ncbi:unnamed protein product [Mytilus coruscus]|uniref:MAM domain-containing protein n=1 Tax=Mytilus coruscus TaxID=42192 RepID=A0A6J8DRM3_MYTCO|nr:unnamed protein product [Mytilus coruscus]
MDVYEQAPFRMTVEAHFKYINSTTVRAILVDDTSIAHRICQGQQVETTCLDMNTPIKIECETQFLAGDIQISLEPENFISQQKNCTKNSIESELNTFCRNFNKWDQCKFNVLDFINGYEDCYVFSKHIAITYQCNDIPKGSIESSTQYDVTGIAAGVSGGILLTIIAVVVICRFSRTIRYPEETVNISCRNTSLIQLQNIGVQEEETSCRLNPCVLNVNDTHTIEDNCNENGTSVSTFEWDFGDWVKVSSNSSTWDRTKFIPDHTQVVQGFQGYSMTAFSFSGTAGTARINTDNEFMKPICLSLWYQFYIRSFDCSFSIYKISDGNQTLLFTAEGNSTSLGQWINILVDVYEQVPFKITLEAHFKYRNSNLARAILIDDTSIVHRPCQGKCELE